MVQINGNVATETVTPESVKPGTVLVSLTQDQLQALLDSTVSKTISAMHITPVVTPVAAPVAPSVDFVQLMQKQTEALQNSLIAAFKHLPVAAPVAAPVALVAPAVVVQSDADKAAVAAAEKIVTERDKIMKDLHDQLVKGTEFSARAIDALVIATGVAVGAGVALTVYHYATVA